WEEDQQHGKGTEYWDYYKIKYEGDFVSGKKTGMGIYDWSSGSPEPADLPDLT
ncbi:MAG: hypothetical protein ACPH5S_07075, partial [Candidatus Poseidoniaceae archaeon]